MSGKPTALDEYVMVFPRELLHKVGYFEGLKYGPEVSKYLEILLDRTNCVFVRRREAELDPDYKQVIPYVLLVYQNLVFSYQRGALLAEKRLRGEYSIGVGGHISLNDPNLFSEPYEAGLLREVNEEVHIQAPYANRVVVLINDDSNDVGRVHFGVVHLFRLSAPTVRPRERSINKAGFVTLDDLERTRSRFENWSQLCIAHIGELCSS